jgi:hypothetical protein
MIRLLLLLLLATPLAAAEPSLPAPETRLDPRSSSASILSIADSMSDGFLRAIRADGSAWRGKWAKDSWDTNQLQVHLLPGEGTLSVICFGPKNPDHAFYVRGGSQLFLMNLAEGKILARHSLPDSPDGSVLHATFSFSGESILFSYQSGKIALWNWKESPDKPVAFSASIAPREAQAARLLHTEDANHCLSIGAEDGEVLRWNLGQPTAEPLKMSQLHFGRIHQSWYDMEKKILAVLGEESRSRRVGIQPIGLLIKRFSGENAGTWIYPGVPDEVPTYLTSAGPGQLFIGSSNGNVTKMDLNVPGYSTKTSGPLTQVDYLQSIDGHLIARSNHHTILQVDPTQQLIAKPSKSPEAKIEGTKIRFDGRSIELNDQVVPEKEEGLDLTEDETLNAEVKPTSNPWIYNVVVGKRQHILDRSERLLNKGATRLIHASVGWRDDQIEYLIVGHDQGFEIYQFGGKGKLELYKSIPTPDAAVTGLSLHLPGKLLLVSTAAGTLNAYRLDLLCDPVDPTVIPIEQIGEVEAFRLDSRPLWRLKPLDTKSTLLWMPSRPEAFSDAANGYRHLLRCELNKSGVFEVKAIESNGKEADLRRRIRLSITKGNLADIVLDAKKN